MNSSNRHRIARASACLAALPGVVLAQSVSVGQIQQILPPDGSQLDQFGRRIELQGDLLVVGAPQDSDAGSSAGSVYLFVLDADGHWGQLRKIYADDAAAFDEFGRDVGADGDLIIVGAPEGLFADDDRPDHGPNAGSAYLFRRDSGGPDNYGQIAKLVANDGQLGDDFGRAVALSGNTALVGARFTDESGYFSGSAYIFEAEDPSGNDWPQRQKLTASDATAGAYFGETVAIDGEVAVVGAPGDLFAGDTPGRAYVYTAAPLGWLETEILAGSGSPGDRFGAAVAVSGNTIAVGAFGSDDDRVHVFERIPDTFDWQQIALLEPPCGELNAQFGQALALQDDLLVVGAPFDDEATENAGALFLYDRHDGTWGFVAKVFAAQGNSLDQFGIAVGVSGETLAAGAPGSDAAARDAGSAYGARLYAADGDGDGVPDLLDNCLDVANGPETVETSGPSQRDTDADGFGNMCDTDLNNDCTINFGDLAMLQAAFFSENADADFNGDGTVDFGDLGLMIDSFFAPPGPSATASCTTTAVPIDGDGLQVVTTLGCEAP